jgi:hypothetical protein
MTVLSALWVKKRRFILVLVEEKTSQPIELHFAFNNLPLL